MAACSDRLCVCVVQCIGRHNKVINCFSTVCRKFNISNLCTIDGKKWDIGQ